MTSMQKTLLTFIMWCFAVRLMLGGLVELFETRARIAELRAQEVSCIMPGGGLL